MTDSKAPLKVVMSDFFAVKSTLASKRYSFVSSDSQLVVRFYELAVNLSGYLWHLPSTLPACITIRRTVVLHG